MKNKFLSFQMLEKGLHRCLRPDDVFYRPCEWVPITRQEAIRLSTISPVVVVSHDKILKHATWFNRDSPFFCGTGPYNLKTLRYYRYRWKSLNQPTLPPKGVSAQTTTETSETKTLGDEVQCPSVVPLKETSWICIELVDDSGLPVREEQYEIELPNGSIYKGVLDANGQAFIDGIDPGICKVSFPHLDAKEWRII